MTFVDCRLAGLCFAAFLLQVTTMIVIHIGPSFSFSFPEPFFPRSFPPNAVGRSLFLDYPSSLVEVLLRPSLFTAAACGVFWIVHSSKFQRLLQQYRSKNRDAYWKNLEQQRAQGRSTRERIPQKISNFITRSWIWRYSIGWMYRSWKQLSDFQKVRSALIGVNLIIFILFQSTRWQSKLMQHFTTSGLTHKLPYTLLTSCFSHQNLDHFIGNMLPLFYVGGTVWAHLGTLKFLSVYLTGGIFGSLTSYIYRYYLPSRSISHGASGAMATLYAIYQCRNDTRDDPFRGENMVKFIAIIEVMSCLYGFSTGKIYNEVDSAGKEGLIMILTVEAHLGGLLFGWWYSKKYLRRN